MAKYETRGRKVAVGGCARAEQLGIDSPHCLRRCNNGIDDFPLSSLHHPLPRAKSRGRAHCYCAREGTNCSRDVPQTAGGLESTADPGKSRTRRGRALTKADPESLPGELGISYHPRLGGGQDFPGDASPLAGNERRRNPSSESSHSSDRPLARLKRERESREGRSLPATIKRLILKVRSRARLIGPSPPPPPPSSSPHRAEIARAMSLAREIFRQPGAPYRLHPCRLPTRMGRDSPTWKPDLAKCYSRRDDAPGGQASGETGLSFHEISKASQRPPGTRNVEVYQN